MNEHALLRLPQIIGDRSRGIPPLIPVGRSTWWQWVSEGKAPAPIKLGPRTTCWRASDVLAFIKGLEDGEATS